MLSNDEIAAKITAGAVAVLPTDTVYGLVCSAASPAAIARLYGLKDRHQNPGTVVAASVEQLVKLGIPLKYLRAVEHYWPNPISIEMPVGSILTEIHQGKGRFAVRIPSHQGFRQLLELTGPLVTTSANQPGEPVALNMAQAQDYFGNSVDFYVDGGDLSHHKPSTIIRIVDDAVDVVREGAVAIDSSGQIIGPNLS